MPPTKSHDVTTLATICRAHARPDLALRPMRPDDLDEVLRLIRLHDSDDWRAAERSLGRVDPQAPERRAAHIVGVDAKEKRVIGVSGYAIDDLEARGVYWLGWTYVNPFFRGRGVGQALLDATIAAVEAFGGRKIFCTTSSLTKYAGAIKFYERSGFREEGRLIDYYAPGEHQVVLGRPLAPGATPLFEPDEEPRSGIVFDFGS